MESTINKTWVKLHVDLYMVFSVNTLAFLALRKCHKWWAILGEQRQLMLKNLVVYVLVLETELHVPLFAAHLVFRYHG